MKRGQNSDVDYALGTPDEQSQLLIIKREGKPEIGIVNFQVHPDVIGGELYYMSHNFDSSYWNDPGFGIMLPLDCKKQAELVPDYWYDFEHK